MSRKKTFYAISGRKLRFMTLEGVARYPLRRHDCGWVLRRFRSSFRFNG